MTSRTLISARKARREDVGDLRTRMPLSTTPGQMIDPFLLLAHHGPQEYQPGNEGLPFGPHPHRGFETVTFVVAGELAHMDTAGHESVIGPGGVQWMTAGSGVVHSETSPEHFKRGGGRLEILQLWVNLPDRLKMSEPRYVGLSASDIPAIALADGSATMALVSGRIGDENGPVQALTDVFLSTIELLSGSALELPAPAGRAVLFYVISGSVQFGDDAVDEGEVAFLSDGDVVQVSSARGATVLFGHSPPIGEPVVARGPFIMTSAKDVEQAFRDFREGRLAASFA